jgi:hypothetical protein
MSKGKYGTKHRVTRELWGRRVELGQVACARCGRTIARGERWHLDHANNGVDYLGPSHARCNVRAAAVKTNKERAAALRASRGLSESAWPTNTNWKWSRCWCEDPNDPQCSDVSRCPDSHGERGLDPESRHASRCDGCSARSTCRTGSVGR